MQVRFGIHLWRKNGLRLLITAGAILIYCGILDGEPPQSYDATSFVGSYIFRITGNALDPDDGTDTIIELGLITADGQGNLTGSETLALEGSIINRSFQGSYVLGPDGSGSMILNPSWGPAIHADIFAADAGRSIRFILTDAGNALTGTMVSRTTVQNHGQEPGFSAVSLDGSYGFIISGYAWDWNGDRSGLITEAGLLTLDGAGNVAGSSTLSLAGLIIRRSFTGMFTLADDGTGALTLYPSWGPPIHANIVVSGGGTRVDLILTDDANAITGAMLAQNGFTAQPNPTPIVGTSRR
jgi:hypothetical protein